MNKNLHCLAQAAHATFEFSCLDNSKSQWQLDMQPPIGNSWQSFGEVGPQYL